MQPPLFTIRTLGFRCERLRKGFEENRRRYEDTLRSFDRFRQGFEIVESLRELRDLPELLDRLRALFKVGLIRLVMDGAEYGPYLSPGFAVLPQDQLAALAGQVLSGGSGSYLGPASEAPEGVLTRPEPSQ
jgi:hypothetical protein